MVCLWIFRWAARWLDGVHFGHDKGTDQSQIRYNQLTSTWYFLGNLPFYSGSFKLWDLGKRCQWDLRFSVCPFYPRIVVIQLWQGKLGFAFYDPFKCSSTGCGKSALKSQTFRWRYSPAAVNSKKYLCQLLVSDKKSLFTELYAQIQIVCLLTVPVSEQVHLAVSRSQSFLFFACLSVNMAATK